MKLPTQVRAFFSEALYDAREEKKLTQEQLAAEASEVLGSMRTADESLWLDEESVLRHLEVSRHHVAGFENFPAAPLSTVAKRLRLRAIAEVLGLDRARLNRLGGGL